MPAKGNTPFKAALKDDDDDPSAALGGIGSDDNVPSGIIDDPAEALLWCC